MKSPSNVLIIGAGISGLSLAYRLQKKGVDTVLLDANLHPGGWVRTLQTDWGLLEAGPRGIRLRGEGGAAFLDLVRDLSLEHKLIGADSEASIRHIYLNGSLEKVESYPWKWPFSKATQGLGRALLQEMIGLPSFRNLFLQTSEVELSRQLQDVSVEVFLCQRFGKDLYKRLFEPALLGVFGASGSLLSASTCLKPFWKAYRHSGGVFWGLVGEGVRGFFSKKEAKPNLHPWDRYPLVSFERGLQELIDALSKRVKPLFHPKQRVSKIHWDETLKLFRVQSSSKLWLAEKVVVACNPWSLGFSALNLMNWDPLISHAQPHSLSLLHLGFAQPLLKEWGFGYLVAPSPLEEILGVVMDSNIFPAHDRSGISRMTVMMPASLEKQSLERQAQKAFEKVQSQLSLSQSPRFTRCSLAEKAMAIYRPGFDQIRQKLNEEIKTNQWPLHFLGVGYGSFSLTQCLAESKKLGDTI